MSKLVFIFSSMNSGKSLQLLTKNYMLTERGFSSVLVKPRTDDRTTDISSRLGVEHPCQSLELTELISTSILQSVKNKPDFILVDEAQFLTKEQVWDLAYLVDNWDINVYCYGLKLQWQGDFFEGSKELFKLADELQQAETFCKYNKGMPALFHIKTGGNSEAVETGYEDLYETVSRKKWKQWYDNK